MQNDNDITLGEVLKLATGDIEILNELKEVIARLADTSMWVINPTKILSQELLNRRVLSMNTERALTIVVEGEEDAE